MSTPGGTSESGLPAGSELKFDTLLISGSFSQDNCRDYSLATCVSWLRLRKYEISMWKHEFRLNRSELYETLTGIRGNLEKLYSKMDRLCDVRQSYLVVKLRRIPATTQAYYREFLAANDEIGDVLHEYIAYANHYNVRYERGELPDINPLHARPQPEIRRDLFEKLDLLMTALGNLAGSLEDPSVEIADVGQDAPVGPERRPA